MGYVEIQLYNRYKQSFALNATLHIKENWHRFFDHCCIALLLLVYTTVSLRIQSEYEKIRTRKTSVFGHFSLNTVQTYCNIEYLHKDIRFTMGQHELH